MPAVASSGRMSRFAVLLLPLILVACTDSVSDVGIDLLGSEYGPNARSVELTEFGVSNLQDYTGGAPRVLAGRVDDPLAGVIDAVGYVDFSGGFSATDTSSIRLVELVLSRSYVYGDTTNTVTLDIHNMAESWNPSGLQADTVLSAGDLAASVTFAPTDTQVTAVLPASWLDQYNPTLRGTDMDSLFHGFRLSGSQGNAIGGFRLTGSSLRLTTTGGTTYFALSQTFTGIRRHGASVLPDNTILFQDGAGPVIKLDFDLAEFADVPINGAVVTVTADTVEGTLAPAGFLRPQIRELQLVAVPEDITKPATLLAQSSLNSDGTYRFVNTDLTTFLQLVFIGAESYSYMELRAPVPDNSLDIALLYNASAAMLAPQAYIILSL